MFTIKHIDCKGNEFAIEAESYSAEVGNDGIFRVTAYDKPHRDDEYIGLWTGARTAMTPYSSAIYVMNRHGSTIATYHYSPDLHQCSLSPELAQAALAQAQAA